MKFFQNNSVSVSLKLYFFYNRILIQTPEANREFYHIMYVQFYCRFAPYLVGIGCAEIYMKTKDKVHDLKASWWKVRDGFQIQLTDSFDSMWGKQYCQDCASSTVRITCADFM